MNALFAILIFCGGIFVFIMIVKAIIFFPAKIYNHSKQESSEPQVDEEFKPILDEQHTHKVEHVPYEDYQLYLQSDRWKAKRTERLKIDEYKCQYCGTSLIDWNTSDPSVLISDNHIPNIHHLHYHTLRNEVPSRDLVSLCKHCHTQLHAEYDLHGMEFAIEKAIRKRKSKY
jgi:5-methylcytosine-specific restriction endonuclease McrA